MFARKLFAGVLLAGLVFSQLAVSSAAAKACNQAQFISDLTVPDGTSYTVGTTFTKTWRLLNIGSCTWTTSYSLVFVKGDQLGAPASTNLPVEVAPGQMVDLSINLAAPQTSGHYRGYWALNDPSITAGAFGIGTSGTDPFWVDINVLGTSAVIYDFVANAPYAEWKSGSGILPYPGASGDNRGYSQLIDFPRLENDSIDSQPGLLTVPQNKYNGFIQATYPEFLVSKGDRLQTLVNCEYGATGCYVTFGIDYVTSTGSVKGLWSWKEAHDGRFYRADIDLSILAGKKVKFILKLLSVGSASGDRAVWGSPRIVRSSVETPPAPPSTLTPLPPLTPTLTPFATAPPISAAGCNKAAFVADITVPDGTLFSPDSAFTKTWRIKNSGSCGWTTAYSLTYYSGERMNAPTSLPLPKAISPGATVDLTLNMTAPASPGKYRGYWILKNAAGELFGIGTNASMPIWIEINVTGSPALNTGYDFAANACSAEWKSGAGILPCPGTTTDKSGFILKMDSSQLEDGTTNSNPALLVGPQNKYNGYVQGIYPTMTVQPGDHFRTTVGCEFGTSCYVAFKLDYMTSTGTITNFWTWREQNEGRPNNIDLDLTPLVGRSVRFILTLSANGSATNDRALWSAPVIIRTNLTPTFTPTSSPTPQVNDWLTYSNSDHGFQFKYPKSSQINEMLENSISMNLPIAAGTNLSQKSLQVIAVQNANPCSSYLGRSSMLSSSETVLINGLTFLKETGGDSAAGQLHQWVAYSTLRGDTCVTFDMILHIINLGNYLTPPPAFNETAEISVLKDVVSTFTWLGATPTPTFTPTPFGYDWPVYFNSKYGFQIQYPKEATLAIQNDNAAHLNLPFAAGTNLKEKIFDIFIREDLQTCRSIIASSSMLVTSETVTINNTTFLKEVGEDGAAGSLYQWVAYSTLKNNACISFEMRLHSISPGVYETPPPIFDYAAETSIIQNMLATFGWSPATSTPTPTAIPTSAATLSAIFEAMNARDYVTLKASMGETFAIAYWQSQGTSSTPDEAIEQLKTYYLASPKALTSDPNRDLTTLLGGANPYTLMGLDPTKSQALLVSGLGPQGIDEAILYMTQRADGTPYWFGLLTAKGGFASFTPYAVTLIATGGVLDVYSAPGISNPIVASFPFDGINIKRTGPTQLEAGTEWVEVIRPDGGTGWVNSHYLTEYIPRDGFCADARIAPIIAQLKNSVTLSDGTLLGSLTSPKHGLNVNYWQYSNTVNYTSAAIQTIYTDPQAIDWGSGGASGITDIGTFAQIVQPQLADVLNSSYELHCNEPSYASMYPTPWRYVNINYYAVVKPPTPETVFDWKVWLVGFEYINGQPYLFGVTHFVWEP